MHWMLPECLCTLSDLKGPECQAVPPASQAHHQVVCDYNTPVRLLERKHLDRSCTLSVQTWCMTCNTQTICTVCETRESADEHTSSRLLSAQPLGRSTQHAAAAASATTPAFVSQSGHTCPVGAV